MNVSSDRLAQSLASFLDSANITGDSQIRSRHAVDGNQPALVCFPAEPAQVAQALRVCAEAEATVAPWGGGTAMQIGNRPTQIDVVIGLHRLNRLLEHDHANLTVTVESGMTLAAIQETLARQNQFLAFDSPLPERATIGGTVVTNLNGPRRTFYGSVRDLVIGMRVALLTGEQIKAGGKVVKNVAGYDMCKLFVGSLGTLGIITEVTLRVSPLPESAATLLASGTLPRVLQFIGELRGSALLPAAIVALNARANHAPPGAWTVAVWCQGFQESVERHLHDSGTMAAHLGLNTEILRNQSHGQLWSEVRNLPLEANRTIFRVTVPLTAISRVLEIIQGWDEPDSSAHVATDACAGTTWISLASAAVGAGWFPKLLALASEQRSHVVMFAAPPAAKEGMDVWGPSHPTLSLMREVKRQFDPHGLLNPGRFVGGI